MKLRHIAVALSLSMSSMIVTAAPIIVSQSQTLTVGGQDMTFLFSALPASNGAGGFITISPSGGTITGLDLSGAFNSEDENFEVTFDGVSQGFYSCNGPSNNGSTAIAGATDNSFNFNDCVFSLPLALADSFLTDGMLTVGVLFGDDVSTFNHLDVVNVSLNFESASVPEPTSLALAGLALLGLSTARRYAKR